MSSSTEKLSPEKYEALAHEFFDAAVRAQNEAVYNFEGGEGALDNEWGGMYKTLAEVLKERLPGAGEDGEDLSVSTKGEESRTKVMGTIENLVGDSPVETTTSSPSMFRRTKENARIHTHKSSHYDVQAADITEETYFLGAPTGKSRKLRVIENDGTATHDRAQFEPYALVETVFEIDPRTAELTVTQNRSNAVQPEHKVVFPSLGLDKVSPDQQWARLATILDSSRPS